MERANRFLRKMIEIIKKPEMRILPGQLAFFLVMSLIPLIALIAATASTFNISSELLIQTLRGALPEGVLSFIIDVINSKGNFNIFVFFASAFLLASNGPHSMIITSNEIYNLKSPNIIRRRIKAILMTFILVGLFFILLVLPISGDYILEIIKVNIANQNAINLITTIYQIVKYPLLIIMLHFNIKLLYMIAPDEYISSMTTTKGAIFTTLGWIIATEVFSFYIGAFTSYDKFYGSMSNIVIMLLWIYILAYIFVLGMIINAGTYREVTETLKVLKDD